MGLFSSQWLLGTWVTLVTLMSSGLGLASAGTGTSDTSNAGDRTAAKRLVEDGNAAYSAKDYSKAISLYMRAFSLAPHPRLLFNVAQALRLAECPERAASFYKRYLTLEPSGGESDAARAALEDIQGGRSRQGAASASDLSSRCTVADTMMTAPLEPTVAPPGRLKLGSEPQGVGVMLDGITIGNTPIEREVAAGAHMISLVQDGRLVGERKIEVRANEFSEVVIPVRPERSRVVPVLLWVGGGLALAGSGVAFYLGQQGGPDHPEDLYVYPGATASGVVLAGIGAAAIGAGFWLWRRGSHETMPVASLSARSGYFGWQGRF